jgi:hypothetical protein
VWKLKVAFKVQAKRNVVVTADTFNATPEQKLIKLIALG